MITHAQEITAGQRFEFGRNWRRFLETIDERRIAAAQESLQAMLGPEQLAGRSFLDAGCGSGLFSLAALRLGATVTSFDYDPQCVACAEELKGRFAPGATPWTIREGSLLDAPFLQSLGPFDVVYSWGVLHQTGDMWRAMGNLEPLVTASGRLHISIYNDQGGWSRRWRAIKRLYNRLPRPLRLPYALAIMGPREARLASIAAATGQLGEYVRSWTHYGSQRGMSRWHDLIDWVGGYPHEVARPEEVFSFFRDRGYVLEQLRTQGSSIAANEFVFRRS